MRRLLYFYKPSSKLYASLDLDFTKAKQLTVVGCQFTEFLLESEEVSIPDFHSRGFLLTPPPSFSSITLSPIFFFFFSFFLFLFLRQVILCSAG